MSNWDQFVNVVLKGEYFIVFIVILMVIILAIILYLVKLQVNGNEEEQSVKKRKIIVEDDSPKITKINTNDIKKEEKVLNREKRERPVYVQSKFNFNEDELKNDLFQVTDDMLEKTQELKNLVETINEMPEDDKNNIVSNNVKRESSKEVIGVRKESYRPVREEKRENVKEEKILSEQARRIERIQGKEEIRKPVLKDEAIVKEEMVRPKEDVKELKVSDKVNPQEFMRAEEEKKEEIKVEIKNEVPRKKTPLEERVEVLNRIQAVTEKRREKENPSIKEYEREQEESAIISYEELHKRKDDIKSGAFKLSDEVIENYEEEQEKKAIISYDELLEKASSTVLTYRDEKVPGLKVNRVEAINKNEPQVEKRPYQREEEFLRLLKEFRGAL